MNAAAQGGMNDTTNPKMATRRRGRAAVWLWLGLIALLGLAVFAVLGLTGRTIDVPDWVVARIETRANAALAGEAHLAVGGAEVIVDKTFVPRVRLRDVTFTTAKGARLAVLPDLRVSFAPQPILRGKLQPISLRLSGARLDLQRRSDGGLDLAFSGVAGAAATALTPAQIVTAVNRIFELPALRRIDRIEAEELEIRLDDKRTGQVWTVSDGRMSMQQTDAALSLTLSFNLAEEGKEPARAEVSLATRKGSTEADLAARVDNVAARDLAAQSPALAWLSALNAPISGGFRTGVDATGAVKELNATLEIGKGAVQPTEGTVPVPFNAAKAYFTYDPARARLDFRELSIDSPDLRMRASAKAWLRDIANGLPGSLVAQIAIADLRADPAGLFADPVVFIGGAIDVKVDLAPFRVHVGQLVLIDGDRSIRAKGKIAAEPGGWIVALDFAIDAISSHRLLALWPVDIVPKTRAWLAENVATGELFDVTAALRLAHDAEPRLALGYEFRDAEVRFLKSLPPIQNGSGYSTIFDNTYTLVVDAGHVDAPQGGRVDVAGSVLTVQDMRIKPAPVRITLRTDSSITGALSLLDQPPFGFLSQAGRPVTIANGRAKVEAQLQVVLASGRKPSDVGFDVTGVLTDVASDQIVPGRDFAAPRMDLRASPAGLEISGPGTLSGVPFRATWRQEFGPDNQGRSRVEGSVELSQNFLDSFNIGLPRGIVSGSGQGRIELDIRRGGPVDYRLTSALGGLGLSIPSIGWSKGTAATGAFEITGKLGQPPVIDGLSLDAPGLKAKGQVTLREGGALDAAKFTDVRLGDWFSGDVTLTGQGKGAPPAVAITKGRADLRSAQFGKGDPRGNVPISVALDRLTVSEGLALTGFRGRFSTAGGFSGQFNGRINGDAPIAGTLVPFEGRSAIRIQSEDAGAVLAASGIFRRGRGGALDLTLRPYGAPGYFEGNATIKNINVVNAPALAELLSAISVVGLLEQLNGSGLVFNTVEGVFRLTPAGVEITKGAAIGAALGVSAAGLYDFSSKRVDLRGTVSPFYILNGIGQIFSRRGEGLFGFNYRLAGPANAPKVSVNPLSILTPGAFRDIFRSAPPKLSQ
jgi:hypothetical protein